MGVIVRIFIGYSSIDRDPFEKINPIGNKSDRTLKIILCIYIYMRFVILSVRSDLFPQMETERVRNFEYIYIYIYIYKNIYTDIYIYIYLYTYVYIRS
jgi:hypothetical protein